jgi:hypothetical protein
VSGSSSLAAKTRRLVVALSFVALGVAGAMAAGPTSATGNSITSPDAEDDAGSWTSLALDSSGNPVVSYTGNDDLKVLRCGNPTCTAGNIIATPDTAGAVRETSIVLDAAGSPAVSYFDFENDDLKLLRCGNPTCTAGNTVVAPDTAGHVGESPSLALDGSGYPVISYFDRSELTLKVLHCGNATCTLGNVFAAPDSFALFAFFTSLALDATGRPVVSYWDLSDLKVLHCGNSTCTAGNTIATPDSAGIVGWYSSLALDTAGNPVIAYGDVTNNELKVLHCGNPACTGGNTISSPDTQGDIAFISLALDSSDNPVVSYYGNYKLKVLHCGNPYCTSGNTIAVPDPALSSTLYTSLALDAVGHPVVSYYVGELQADLKVLKCGDPDCIAIKPTATPSGTATRTPTVTPTSTSIATSTPTPTPRAALGGVAAYPAASSRDGKLSSIALAISAVVLLAAGGSVWYTRRQRN